VLERPRRRWPSAALGKLRKARAVRRIERLKEASGIELDVERMLADLDADRRSRDGIDP